MAVLPRAALGVALGITVAHVGLSSGSARAGTYCDPIYPEPCHAAACGPIYPELCGSGYPHAPVPPWGAPVPPLAAPIPPYGAPLPPCDGFYAGDPAVTGQPIPPYCGY